MNNEQAQDTNPEIAAVLDRVRSIRQQKKITILELSNNSGIARSYLYYLECKQKIPTLTVLDKLAKAMGVSMRDFF